MKAITYQKYGGPDVLNMTEVDKPVPGKNEILIRVRATTVSVADCRSRAFRVPLVFWIPARIALGIFRPRKAVLGAEFAGVIESVGPAVTKFKPGDRIAAATVSDFGGYGEYTSLPEHGTIAILPESMEFSTAAAIPIGARTALHYLRRGEVKRGDRVLVYGASGSVGTYAVQLAAHMGARVTGVCSGKNRALVESLGAERVVDYGNGDLDDLREQYDAVFIAIDQWPFQSALQVLKKGGSYLNVTSPFKTRAMRKAAAGQGIKFVLGELSTRKAKDLQYLIDLADSGVLKPVIDRRYGFSEIREAHSYVDQGHKKGNVVIEMP